MRTLLACLVAVTVTAAATAAPITTLFSTGVNGSGGLLADGAVDPHYTVTGGGGPFTIGNAGSIWGAGNTLTSQWISPALNTQAGNGPFNYTTTFDLTGFDPATAAITGQWSADNEASMYLNGVLVASTPGLQFGPWQYFTPFAINAGFISGVNTLTFVVTNSENGEDPDGATGLNVRFLSATADATQNTPEPISLLVFGGLVLGGGLVARKRLTKKAVA